MSFRVGYINVQGGAPAKWEACKRLVERGELDYLFIGETWYVRNEERLASPYGMGSSTQVDFNVRGREKGGVMLIASKDGKARATGWREGATPYSVSFTRDGERFTGVYLPPSLEPDEFRNHVQGWTESTVVVGDMNTRFYHEQQVGTPTRAQRVRMEVINDFASQTRFRPLWPENQVQKVNLDHCWVRPRAVRLRLDMWKAEERGLTGDHKFGLSICCTGRQPVEAGEQLTRFRIAQLKNQMYVRQLITRIQRQPARFFRSENVDEMNDQLVSFCQRIQTESIGKSRVDPTRVTRYQPERMDPNTTTSNQLYKEAADESMENDAIVPTQAAREAGKDAMTENVEGLIARWQGRPFQRRQSQDGNDNQDQDLAQSRQEDQYPAQSRQEDQYPAQSRQEDQYEAQTRQEDQYLAQSRQKDQYLAQSRQEDQYEAQTRQEDQYLAQSRQEDQYEAQTRQEDQCYTPSRQKNQIDVQNDDDENDNNEKNNDERNKNQRNKDQPDKESHVGRTSIPAGDRGSSRKRNKDQPDKESHVKRTSIPGGDRGSSRIDQNQRSDQQADDRSPDENTVRVQPRQIREEIQRQEADKACGADGIHIEFLKKVRGTQLVDWLGQLFNQCIKQGQTPRAWNQSEIHLLTKDQAKPREATNVRPISIIGIFRKVFERLILLQVEGASWARCHRAQAGFRRAYSTYTNAAVVHTMLSSQDRKTAIFLDFKQAFDVVDHELLDRKLEQRQCPGVVRRLIQSLMFTDQRSRALVNGKVSQWFRRTRGVPQGSPLSPWLFNLFVDDLIQEVNRDERGVPVCLFYADDGVLLPRQIDHVPAMLDIVARWTHANRIELNVKKCQVVSAERDCPPVWIEGEEIPRVTEGTYLGFPVTDQGIDFKRLLETRFAAAVAKVRWLGLWSNSWGPAHRLRIFKTYIAPMYEYGGPLVVAWGTIRGNKSVFNQATRDWSQLMDWIANKQKRQNVTANLCGLLPVQIRMQHLHTRYQLILEEGGEQNPLQQLIRMSRENPIPKYRFIRNLSQSEQYRTWLDGDTPGWTREQQLTNFLKVERWNVLQREAQKIDLLSQISMDSRRVPGLYLADMVFQAPIYMQDKLLQYRRGLLRLNYPCVCGEPFQRGHEEKCNKLGCKPQLSRTDWKEMGKVQATGEWPEQPRKRGKWDVELRGKEVVETRKGVKFTRIDFLISKGEFKLAWQWIQQFIVRLDQNWVEKEKTKEET